MSHSCRCCFVALIFLVSVPTPTGFAFQNQTKGIGDKDAAMELPDAATVIKRYTDALGGDMHLGEITNYVMKGCMKSGDRVVMTFEMNFEDQKCYITYLIGRTEYIYGSDGETRWSINQSGKPEIQDSQDANWLWCAVGIDAANWGAQFESIECVGIEKLPDGRAYCLEFKTGTSLKLHRYFDVDSGLMTRSVVFPTEKSKTKTKTTTDYKDYKQAGDFLLPHKWDILTNSQNAMAYEIESFETCVDLPKRLFELPDPVKKLLDKNQ